MWNPRNALGNRKSKAQHEGNNVDGANNPAIVQTDSDSVSDFPRSDRQPEKPASPASDEGLLLPPSPPADSVTRMVLDARSVWRAAWTIVAVLAITALLRFFLTDGAAVVFLLIMSFFIALAMEPAVVRLSTWMPRPAATAITMLTAAVAMAVFFVLFGSLLVDQLSNLIQSIPQVVTSVLTWVNSNFDTNYSTDTILQDMGLDNEKIRSYATSVAGGLTGVLSGLFSAVISLFAFAFFTYYLSAGMPALRSWLAGLMRPNHQVVFLTVWQLILTKVGNYVGARIILAAVCGSASGIFMLIIGMPYWLPLAMWTGLVAQFVPNVGTYIAIALPVVVGFSSDEPRRGLLMLVFALVYQQIENITIEPRISARAVDVHPVVSFSAALAGAQLFGVAGATLGVPVAATIMAIIDIYKQRWDVTKDTEQQAAQVVRDSVEREKSESDNENEDSGPENSPLERELIAPAHDKTN